jgi:hypothetical protein
VRAAWTAAHLLRLQGDIDMQACMADLHLQADLALHGARGRLALRCVGAAPLRASLRRETAEPPLLPVMQAARLSIQAAVRGRSRAAGGRQRRPAASRRALHGRAGG